jgi:hypothetical protein
MEIRQTRGRRVVRLTPALGLRNAVGVFRAVGRHPALLLVKNSTRRVKSRHGHDRKNTVNDGMQCYSLVTLDGGGDYTCRTRRADRRENPHRGEAPLSTSASWDDHPCRPLCFRRRHARASSADPSRLPPRHGGSGTRAPCGRNRAFIPPAPCTVPLLAWATSVGFPAASSVMQCVSESSGSSIQDISSR